MDGRLNATQAKLTNRILRKGGYIMARPRKLPAGMLLRGKTYHAQFRAGGRLVRKRLSADFTTACQLLNELRVRADKADFGQIDNDCSWAESQLIHRLWR